MQENHYDETQIQVLEGLEAVRKRPGMYIGTTSIRGLHHLVYEIVDNSIDEALAGYCDTIRVILNPDNSVTVIDNGRGIPAAIHPKQGIPTPEVVYTILHAGGKFGGGGYKIAGGLHGVGASVVNALSEWVELDNAYEGKRYTERFERGKVARKFNCEGESPERPHGVKVTFKPDPTIFEEIVFDYDTLLNRMREQSFLNAGIRRIPVQYAKKVQGRKMVGGQTSNIPLKVNTSGVIPIIFASSILQTPIIITSLFGNSGSGTWGEILKYLNSSNWCKPSDLKYTIGLVVYIVMVIFFAYFYTAITFNPMMIADNMKKQGGFIPGIRPGKPTSEYLNRVLNYIIFIGAVGLIIVAVLPFFFNGVFGARVSFGGTSLIIIVSVILETVKSLESQMLVRNYKVF